MARSSKLESGFQDGLKREIADMLPGCMIFKMDQMQGIPDLLILYGEKWASLECKKNARAARQPNQEYWVDVMSRMAFSAFVYPENKYEILDELARYFNS